MTLIFGAPHYEQSNQRNHASWPTH
jgi:hypothetical protein